MQCRGVDEPLVIEADRAWPLRPWDRALYGVGEPREIDGDRFRRLMRAGSTIFRVSEPSGDDSVFGWRIGPWLLARPSPAQPGPAIEDLEPKRRHHEPPHHHDPRKRRSAPA